MSKLVESLQSQMRAIFGDSFGEKSEPVGNLTETIETALLERRGGRKALARKSPPQMRGGDFSSAVKNKKTAVDVEKKTQGRIKRNMSAFFKHADKEAEKSAKRPRPEKLQGKDQQGSDPRKASKQSTSSGGGGQHNPFKHSPNLGTGPGTPPGFRQVQGKRHHDEKKCWNCRCGNVYDKGCECTGTGKTKDCPKGHVKHVQIKKDYRHAYNDMYHAWRRGEGKHANRKGKWQGPRR